MCDLKLVFLRPGIFGELKLKKRHGQLPPLIVEHSPPEFPVWTDTVPGVLSTVTYIPNLPSVPDTADQDPSSIQIKQEDTTQDGVSYMPGRVETLDESRIISTKSEPLTG